MDLEHVPLAEIDLSDPEFWLAPASLPGERLPHPAGRGAGAVLRGGRVPALPQGPRATSPSPATTTSGTASRNPQLFCSGQGINIPDMPHRDRRVLRLDDQHGRPAPRPPARDRAKRASRPRMVGQIEGYVRAKADGDRRRPARAAPDGECDFVEEVAAPLPLQIICEMMGIPRRATSSRSSRWTNIILGVGDPEYGADVRRAHGAPASRCSQYAQELGAGPPRPTRATTSPRRSCTPRSTASGSRTQEFGSFFILLVVAGNETTRNAISHGMKALTDHPDQRALWCDDFDGDRHDRGRGDRALGHAGHPLPPHGHRGHRDRAACRSRPGEKVVLWYNSANRDERRLRRPVRVRRPPRRPTRRSASAPAARTSASAPTWPAARSRSCSTRSAAGCPTSQITGEPDLPAVQLHPRHQAHALRLEVALSRACRRGSGGGRAARSGPRRRRAGPRRPPCRRPRRRRPRRRPGR